MTETELNLCDIELGRITAAAGHGKTQLIANSLLTRDDPYPVLVLTHTNAGVHSLRQLLRHLEVPSHRYRVEAIDAFMLRLVRAFPHRSGYRVNLNIEELRYPILRRHVLQLVSAHHLDAIDCCT